jgi:hypothetical protein
MSTNTDRKIHSCPEYKRRMAQQNQPDRTLVMRGADLFPLDRTPLPERVRKGLNTLRLRITAPTRPTPYSDSLI